MAGRAGSAAKNSSSRSRSNSSPQSSGNMVQGYTGKAQMLFVGALLTARLDEYNKIGIPPKWLGVTTKGSRVLDDISRTLKPRRRSPGVGFHWCPRRSQ